MRNGKIAIAGAAGVSLAIFFSLFAFSINSAEGSFEDAGQPGEISKQAGPTAVGPADSPPRMAPRPRFVENPGLPAPGLKGWRDMRLVPPIADGDIGPDHPQRWAPRRPETAESLAILATWRAEFRQYSEASKELRNMVETATPERQREISGLLQELSMAFVERQTELNRLHREAIRAPTVTGMEF